eukprot:6214349-Pleurochrysis_carterae.AAC.2
MFVRHVRRIRAVDSCDAAEETCDGCDTCMCSAACSAYRAGAVKESPASRAWQLSTLERTTGAARRRRLD